MPDPTIDQVRDALHDELRIWLVDPLHDLGDEGKAEDFEQCVANVWAIVTDPKAVMALLAEAPQPKVLATGTVGHYIGSTTHEADNALIAIEVGAQSRNFTTGQRVIEDTETPEERPVDEPPFVGRPGQVVRYRGQADWSTSVLCCRKSSGDGWWLRDGDGSLSDRVLTDGLWELLDEFRDGPPCRCSTCPHDREILDLWAELGMPDDQSTRDYALGLLMKLWDAYKEQNQAVAELLGILDGFLCGCGDALDDVHRPGGKCGNCLAADDEPAADSAAVTGPEPDPEATVAQTIPDLMAALEASVNEAKAARDRHPQPAADPAGGEPLTEETTDG